jgi:hypothetical protein
VSDPWVAPGAEETSAQHGPGRTAVETPAGRGPFLRPRTMADLLDGGFVFLKQQPRTAITIAAVFAIPIQLVVAWLQRDSIGSAGLVEIFSDPTGFNSAAATEDGGGSGLASVIGLVGPSVALPFIAGAVAAVLSATHSGRAITAGEALRAAGRRWWALLAAWVLVHLLEGVATVLLVLPMLAVMALCLVTAPAIVLEGLGPVAGMRRSFRLCSGRFWSVLAVGVVSGLVVGLVSEALVVIPQLIGESVGGTVGWVLVGVSGSVASLIAWPVLAAVTVLVYFDLRVRLEGLDLELDAVDLFRRDR